MYLAPFDAASNLLKLSLFHYHGRVRIVTCETMPEALHGLAPATTF